MLHVLFVVFAVLGFSLWGISEFLLSAEKKSREISAESAQAAAETKRILLEYAITPPPPAVQNVADCGLDGSRGCYNHFVVRSGGTLYAKYEPFTLPCPDLITDDNLDGASDTEAGCNGAAGALGGVAATIGGGGVTLGHRFGRLPWRDERGDNLYARGLGNRDLRDGAGARLWYGLSRNVAPCVVDDPVVVPSSSDDAPCPPLEADALLRLTTGWLTVISQDSGGNEIVLSDRVAAVVISPGSADLGQTRPDEDLLYSGGGGLPGSASGAGVTVSDYLEGENADLDDTFFAPPGVAGIRLQGYGAGISAADGGVRMRHSEDHLEFLTIEEIVAASEAELSAGQQTPSLGGGDFDNNAIGGARVLEMGAALMEGYYRRVGNYPDPSIFQAESATVGWRLPGSQRNTVVISNTGEVVTVRRARGVDGLREGLEIPLSDLPLVYLLPGWRFPDQAGNFATGIQFPFNEALADLKTELSERSLASLAGDVYSTLYARTGHVIPEDRLYGLNVLTLAEPTAAQMASMTLGVAGTAPLFDFNVRAREMRAEAFLTVQVALAEPMALNSTSSLLAEYAGNDGTPRGGADVILPTGTILEFVTGTNSRVQFASDTRLRATRYQGTAAGGALTPEEIQQVRDEHPGLQHVAEVRDASVAHINSAVATGPLTFDDDAVRRNAGVGTETDPDATWVRPGEFSSVPSDFELRPIFNLEGPAVDAGYNVDGLPTNLAVSNQPHQFVLSGFEIRKASDAGETALVATDLVGGIEFPTEVRAFRFPGDDHTTVPYPPPLDNSYLDLYFEGGSDAANGPGRSRKSDQVQTGRVEQGGEGVTIYFDSWPFTEVFSQAVLSEAGVPTGACLPPSSPACPYSAGFFADEVLLSLDISPAFFARGRPRSTGGVELLAATELPARVRGLATGFPARVLPDGLEGAAGRMGFAPVQRAVNGMDPAYFTALTVRKILSADGNLAARLYFPITAAAAGSLSVLPLPPAGRPNILGAYGGGGADTSGESGLAPLSGPVGLPAGEPIPLPAGTHLIVPEIRSLVGLDLGREFEFPDGAVAVLPPGSVVPAEIAAGTVLPSGIAAGTDSDRAVLLNGGIADLSGARLLTENSRFDEMAEFEVRGRATAEDIHGAMVELEDGSLVQPFTGRAIVPHRAALLENARIVGATRTRAQFLRRPQRATRTGERDEPSYLMQSPGGGASAEQSFSAGDFLRDDGTTVAAIDLAFDESTEFLLPSEFTLTVTTAMWPSPGSEYAAVEYGGDPFYRIAPKLERTRLPLHLTLPAGTRIYDDDFVNLEDADGVATGGGLETARALAIPLAADLGGPAHAFAHGQARFNFALFPESDLILEDNNNTTPPSIPGGSVVDIVRREVIPPVGAARISRVAGDAELISNGEMVIYLGGDAEIEYEYSEPDIMQRPHVSSIAVPFVETGGGARDYGSIKSRMLDVFGGLGAANDLAVLPAGTFIVIPAGERLTPFPNYAITAASGYRRHLRLPANAVAALPSGTGMRFSAPAGSPTFVEGPGYVRLGGVAGNGRAVAPNLVLHNAAGVEAAGRSFVMLSRPARLRSQIGARVGSASEHIPQAARLDLFGNMETRAEGTFLAEMLPSEARVALKNFPLAYAVAPECRRSAAASGDCDSSDFQGLTFEIPRGEEIRLPTATPAPERFRVQSPDGGEAFVAELYELSGNRPGAGPPKRTENVHFVWVDPRGRISVRYQRPPPTPDAAIPRLTDPFPRDTFSQGDPNPYLVLRPPASGAPLRVLLGTGAPRDGGDPGGGDSNYVDVTEPITVYNGGYVGDSPSDYRRAEGVSELREGSEFLLAGDSRPFDGGLRRGVFAAGSVGEIHLGTIASAPSEDLDLSDYVPVNDGTTVGDHFQWVMTLGAQIAQVDLSGRTELKLEANTRAEMQAGDPAGFRRERAYLVASSRGGAGGELRLRTGQTLKMDPGYLWQGRIPAGGVALEFSRNDRLHHAWWPPYPDSEADALMQSRIHLRVHPSDLRLNFFGSGLETVEGLDGETAGSRARESLAMSEALYTDFNRGLGSDRFNNNMGGWRVPIAATGSTVMARPYLFTSAEAQSAGAPRSNEGQGLYFVDGGGVNPDGVLQTPATLRANINFFHVVEMQNDGTYTGGGKGAAGGHTYSGTDPLFFTNFQSQSAHPIPGHTDSSDDRNYTRMPVSGAKIRRVEWGMEPRAARLGNYGGQYGPAHQNHEGPHGNGRDLMILHDGGAPFYASQPDRDGQRRLIGGGPDCNGAGPAAGVFDWIIAIFSSRGRAQLGKGGARQLGLNLWENEELYPGIPLQYQDRHTAAGADPDPYGRLFNYPAYNPGNLLSDRNNWFQRDYPCADYGRAQHNAGYNAKFAISVRAAPRTPDVESGTTTTTVTMTVTLVIPRGTGLLFTCSPSSSNYIPERDRCEEVVENEVTSTVTLFSPGRILHNEPREALNAEKGSALNPPMLAAVRDLNTGEVITVTTHWTNYYYYDDTGNATVLQRRGEMLWGANRAALDMPSAAREAVAAVASQHSRPGNVAVPGTRNFLWDQDWDVFAFSGVNAGNTIRSSYPENHVGALTGPYNDRAWNHPDNRALSGLDGTALGGMCGVNGADEQLEVRFSNPPIQLVAHDITPGLAWPRPGRALGTADPDKRIRGAFVPRAERQDLMRRLSPLRRGIPTPVASAPDGWEQSLDDSLRVQAQHRMLANPERFAEIEGVEAALSVSVTRVNFFGIPAFPIATVTSTVFMTVSFRAVDPPDAIPSNRAMLSYTGGEGATPWTTRDIGAGERLTTHFFSELYLYMDRPHDPRFMGGEQGLVIGDDFRVEGMAAVVPPFGALRDSSAADLYTQRSRMMTDLFNAPRLRDIYSDDLSGSPDCGSIRPCPAMFTRNDWAPILGGVVALEAVDLEIKDLPRRRVRDQIYFILPQPELEVELDGGGKTTLFAGSVIYPFSGRVIPAGKAPGASTIPIDRVEPAGAVDVSPAAAPAPVRIFREKTHTTRPPDSTALVERKLIAGVQVHVEAVNLAGGIVGNACRILLQGAPPSTDDGAPGYPSGQAELAAPNLVAGTVAMSIISNVWEHRVVAVDASHNDRTKMLPRVRMTSDYLQPANADGFSQLTIIHNYGNNLRGVEGLIFNVGGARPYVRVALPSPGVEVRSDAIQINVGEIPALRGFQLSHFNANVLAASGEADGECGVSGCNLGAERVETAGAASALPGGLVFMQALLPLNQCAITALSDNENNFGVKVTATVRMSDIAPTEAGAGFVVPVTVSVTLSLERQLTIFPVGYEITVDDTEIAINDGNYQLLSPRFSDNTQGVINLNTQCNSAALRGKCTVHPGQVDSNGVLNPTRITLTDVGVTLRIPTRFSEKAINSYDFSKHGVPGGGTDLRSTYHDGNLVNEYASSQRCRDDAGESGCFFFDGHLTRFVIRGTGDYGYNFVLREPDPLFARGFQMDDVSLLYPGDILNARGDHRRSRFTTGQATSSGLGFSAGGGNDAFASFELKPGAGGTAADTGSGPLIIPGLDADGVDETGLSYLLDGEYLATLHGHYPVGMTSTYDPDPNASEGRGLVAEISYSRIRDALVSVDATELGGPNASFYVSIGVVLEEASVPGTVIVYNNMTANMNLTVNVSMRNSRGETEARAEFEVGTTMVARNPLDFVVVDNSTVTLRYSPLDSSPALEALPYLRTGPGTHIHGSEMNYAPVRAKMPDGTDSSCVVEPLGFLPMVDITYPHPDPARSSLGMSVVSRMAPLADLTRHEAVHDEPSQRYWLWNDGRQYDVAIIGHGAWSRAHGFYPSYFQVKGSNVNEVRRYDGTFTRGFLAAPRTTEILAAYYSGDPAWRGEGDNATLTLASAFPNPESNATLRVRNRPWVTTDHVFSGTRLPYRDGDGDLGLNPKSGSDDARQARFNLDINLSDAHPRANEMIRLRNPLSHLWQNRNPNLEQAEQLGARRLENNHARAMVRQKTCRASQGVKSLRNNVADGWCVLNRGDRAAPYGYHFNNGEYDSRMGYWGIRTDITYQNCCGNQGYFNLTPPIFGFQRTRKPWAPMGVRLHPEDGTTRPIQALRLPHVIRPAQGSALTLRGLERPPYPSRPGRFFRLPSGATARQMNIDLSSWESIHPAMVAGRSGQTYRHINAADRDTFVGLIDAAPAALGPLDFVPGETFSEMDVGDLALLHYHRSESSPGEEPTSARQAYANIWFRLQEPSELRQGGNSFSLSPDTLINPMFGTFTRLPSLDRRENRDARLPYPSTARALSNTAPLQLVRPALILPAGAKVVLQQRPAEMRKVRAAVFFSPAPLRRTQCAGTGNLDQLRDGGLLDDGILFTPGHPCAWLDEEENTDGDRRFIYHSRPRWNNSNTRIISNDRVVMLGGELAL